MKFVEYTHNNANGEWLLVHSDWLALEAAGWKVLWPHLQIEFDKRGATVFSDDGLPNFIPKENGDSDESITPKAFKADTSEAAAIADWERATGKSAKVLGCRCCGDYHYFES